MRSRLRQMIIPALTATAGLLAATHTGAQEGPRSFTSAFFPRSGEMSSDVRNAVLSELAARQPDPQHVVVLVHGFDTPTFLSADEYSEVAPRVLSEFQKHNRHAVVLGVQWDSNVGPQRKWLPAAFGHLVFRTLGLRKVIRDPYTSRIPIARTVGRTGFRDLLFSVCDRFPNARVHVFSHSMGAEVTAHAINPEYTPAPRNSRVAYPGRPLKLDVVAMAGADLDFDSGARSKPVNPQAAPNLLWLTLPKVGTRGDKVLNLRKKVRSKAAIGNTVPSFREDQYDALISSRRLIFDSREIPSSHALTEYWGAPRLSRIVAAAIGVAEPEQNPSELLRRCSAVLAAQPTAAAIQPFLLGDETSPKVYALWRLEQLLCGSSKHMANGYAEKVLSNTLRDAAWWDAERLHTECKVVQQGYWPPSDVVEAARSRKPKHKERKGEGKISHGFFKQPLPSYLASVRQQ